MRRVRISGTPPADWLAEADAVTAELQAAAALVLEAKGYTIELFPDLKAESDLPGVGKAVLAVGALNGSLRLKAFDGVGVQIAHVKEAKREPAHSPILEMHRLLDGNWDVAKLKPFEKNELFRIATAIVRGSKIETIIRENENIWTDDRIRNWLLKQFNNKCWYAEAQDTVSSIHVDHYRPKGQVADDLTGNTSSGYWWQAFRWSNYRMCGQLVNVKKRDVFPFADATRGTPDDPDSLVKECPILIDPCSEETRFVSFEMENKDSCVAVLAGDLQPDEAGRAERTIEILGLNRLPRLNSKRAQFWSDCSMEIANYRGASGPQCLKQVAQAAARAKLKKMVAYGAEFSSVAEACIRKYAPEALKASVFAAG
jgi:hypothetical protein